MARYTPAEKSEAVSLYVEHGLAEAHHRSGIPRASLQRWAEAAGHDLAAISGHTAAKTAAAHLAVAQRWQDRRDALKDEFGEVAELALAKCKALLEAGKTAEAQKAIVCAAVGVDKAQLLSGDATSIARVPWERKDLEAEAEPVARGLRAVG